MRLAFVVGDARAQRPGWATAYLALAAARRGHDVCFVDVDDLTLTADDQVLGLARRPAGACRDNAGLCAALADERAPAVEERLSGFDLVLLRHHPTREGARPGGGGPAIDFGLRLRQGGVLVVNDPEGVRRAGGRMYLSGLPPEIRPRTLITREPARLKAFLKALDAPAVLKPLADHGAGADTVFTVGRGQVKNLNQMIAVVRKHGYVVAQEYLPGVGRGEKRLLLVGGEPVRAGGRVAVYRRARDGAGGVTRRRCRFGAAEERIVDLLRPRLAADGLHLAGVDVVGGKVLDLNVFTPGGFRANLELYGIDVAAAVIADLEQRVADGRARRVA